MNIDDLSKSQLLLLTLLVNFVMSIATGIVTVALLDESSATVTQTVNRIVEHTIETVVPATVTTNDTKQPTEEDLLVAAIAANASRAAYLYKDATTSVPLAQGVYLPKSRAFVVFTDSKLPDEAIIGFANGASAEVSVSRKSDVLTIYGFSDGTSLPSASPTTLLTTSDLKQGQAVISVMADGSAVTGIISKIDGMSVTTTLPQTPKGAAAVTLRGSLVGLSTGEGSAYLSASEVNALLSAPATSSVP
ncbi:MAG: hypothetical protein WAV21_03075 [Minisyncoccia bacterium]